MKKASVTDTEAFFDYPVADGPNVSATGTESSYWGMQQTEQASPKG